MHSKAARGFVALPLLLALAGGAAGSQEDDGLVVGSGVELVRLDVVVLDRQDRPVTGLSPEDFVVEDEGEPQPIVSFEAVVVERGPRAEGVATPPVAAPPSASSLPEPDEARHLLIFFDDIHVSAVAAQYVRTQLSPFLDAELRDGDTVTVVAPQSGLWWTARTPYEYARLPQVVASLSGHLVRDPFSSASSDQRPITEWEAMERVENPEKGLAISNELPVTSDLAQRHAQIAGSLFRDSDSRRTMLHEEIYAMAMNRLVRTLKVFERAVAALAGFRGHKSLVFFSEGFILSPRMKERYDRAIDAAQRARVAVHLVDPQGLLTGAPEASYGGPVQLRGHEGLRREQQIAGTMQVVFGTGGREFQGNDLVRGVRQALVESSSYYLIGYEMPERRHDERRIGVRVRREGLRVLAPDRYFATPREPEAESAEDALLDAIYDETDVPLRVRSLLGGATPEGEVEATLVVEVGSGAADELSVSVEARPATGGPALRGAYETRLDRRQGPALTSVGLKLAPGLWQARVLVEERGSGRRGSALHTFEVTEGRGLRVSTPFVSDELVDGVSPRLHVDWTYAAGSPVHVGFGVWGAATDAGTGEPRVIAHYTLTRDGAVVAASDAPLLLLGQGALWGRIAFPPGTLEPGLYVLEIEATDTLRQASHAIRETFTLVPGPGSPGD